jgi:hypothetical protein
MDTQPEEAGKPWYIFLPICIGLGTGLGALLDNIGVGIAIGTALGTLLNLIAYHSLIDRE